jgi:hypothetical protein
LVFGADGPGDDKGQGFPAVVRSLQLTSTKIGETARLATRCRVMD